MSWWVAVGVEIVGVGAGHQQRDGHHQRDRGDDRDDADHPGPARRPACVHQLGLVVLVVVVERGIGRHVRARCELLGLGRRVGLRMDLRLTGGVRDRFSSAVDSPGS